MINIYAIFAARPDFIPLLDGSLKRFLSEEHRLVIINDGQGKVADEIKDVSNGLDLMCDSVYLPRRDTANYAHARSVQYTYERWVKNDLDISVIMDGDIFLMQEFSISRWMDTAQLCGPRQNREHVVYPWAGLLFLNMATMPDRDKLSFWPDKVDGVSCDNGGHAHEFIQSHPDLRVKWIPQGGVLGDPFGMELFAGAFLHYGGATNWRCDSAEYHHNKTKSLKELLAKSYLGELNLCPLI